MKYKILILAILIGLFAVVDQMRESFYRFDPNVLHKVAKDAINKNLTGHALFNEVALNLEKIYPDFINDRPNWVFNMAGGAMGQMW